MKKLLLFLAVLVLLLSLLACPAGEPTDGTKATASTTAAQGGGNQPGDGGTTTTATGTTGSENGENQPSGEAIYTVNVRDAKGERAENVVVRLTGGDVSKIVLCEGGVATFTLPVGEYTVTVEAPDGDFYHQPLTLTPTSRTGNVTLYGKLTKYTKVSAYSAAGKLTDNLRAYTLGEGSYYTTLKGATRSYFVFTPTRGGIYRISVDTEASCELGCFGNPLAGFYGGTDRAGHSSGSAQFGHRWQFPHRCHDRRGRNRRCGHYGGAHL